MPKLLTYRLPRVALRKVLPEFIRHHDNNIEIDWSEHDVSHASVSGTLKELDALDNLCRGYKICLDEFIALAKKVEE